MRWRRRERVSPDRGAKRPKGRPIQATNACSDAMSKPTQRTLDRGYHIGTLLKDQYGRPAREKCGNLTNLVNAAFAAVHVRDVHRYARQAAVIAINRKSDTSLDLVAQLLGPLNVSHMDR